MRRGVLVLAGALILAMAGSASAATDSEEAATTPAWSQLVPPTAIASFTLTSGAFRNGASIPSRYTCDGANVSPALSWGGVPHGAVTLGLIVEDIDARGFVHWLAYNIARSSPGGLPTAVPRLASPPRQGINAFGRAGYGGPCPPSGRHRYRFTLYALDRVLTFTGKPRAVTFKAAIRGHVIGQAVLVGTYRRR